MLEPALRNQVDRLDREIHYPDDTAEDVHRLTRPLAGICASERVEFRNGETVEVIDVSGCEFSSIRTNPGRVDADVRVVARSNGHS